MASHFLGEFRAVSTKKRPWRHVLLSAPVRKGQCSTMEDLILPNHVCALQAQVLIRNAHFFLDSFCIQKPMLRKSGYRQPSRRRQVRSSFPRQCRSPFYQHNLPSLTIFFDKCFLVWEHGVGSRALCGSFQPVRF